MNFGDSSKIGQGSEGEGSDKPSGKRTRRPRNSR